MHSFSRAEMTEKEPIWCMLVTPHSLTLKSPWRRMVTVVAAAAASKRFTEALFSFFRAHQSPKRERVREETVPIATSILRQGGEEEKVFSGDFARWWWWRHCRRDSTGGREGRRKRERGRGWKKWQQLKVKRWTLSPFFLTLGSSRVTV